MAAVVSTWLRNALLACATLLIPGWALAQAAGSAPTGTADSSQAPSNGEAGLSEIVVTATRRSESLQDVPIAVTALSGQSLEQYQMTDIESVQRATPNTNIKEFVGDPTNIHISIRGPSFEDSLITSDQPVGLYLDGVYLSRGPGGNFDLLDIDRVEVLRGPQGTLFGRNTIGGAIDLIANKPQNDFEGYVQASYGNYDASSVAGVINLPLSDKAALRIVASNEQREGFASSALTGQQLGGTNTDFTRIGLKLDPTANWDILLTGDYTRVHTQPAWITLVGVTPLANEYVASVTAGADTASAYVSPLNRHPMSQSTQGVDSNVRGLSGVVTGNLDGVTFKSITAYRDINHRIGSQDLDSTPYLIGSIDAELLTQHQFSQEDQLYGKSLDNKLDWIVGTYFFTETGNDFSAGQYLFPTFDPLGPQGTDGVATNDNYSSYAQLTYSITEKLSLTGGVRFSHDSRDLTTFSKNYLPDSNIVFSCSPAVATPPSCEFPQKQANYQYIPFTAGLEFKPLDSILLYAKFSRGFRSGGFNLRGSTPEGLAPFGPERMDTWEIGQKGEYLDHHIRFNVDAYYSNYDSIQLAQNVVDESTGGSTSLISNAGTGRIYGVEGEAAAIVGNLELNASFGTADARYTHIDPGVPYITLNTPFPETSKFTGFAAADYRIPAPLGKFDLHMDFNYKSRLWYGAQTNLPLDQPGFGIANGMIAFDFDHPRVQVSLWGRNLFDKKYLAYILDESSIGFVDGMPGDPFTFGMSAKYSF